MGGAETSKFGPIPQFGDFRSIPNNNTVYESKFENVFTTCDATLPTMSQSIDKSKKLMKSKKKYQVINISQAMLQECFDEVLLVLRA